MTDPGRLRVPRPTQASIDRPPQEAKGGRDEAFVAGQILGFTSSMLAAPARLRSLPRRFVRSDCGVVALEFALIAPFLITLLLGSFELSRYVNTMRRITFVSSSIAEILSQNTSGYLNWTDILTAVDSTMLTFPGVLSDSFSKGINWKTDIKVSMASVQFTPTVSGCTTGCTYVAAVVWNYGPNPRPCVIPQVPAPDTATPSPAFLPADAFGPGSVIVVDVVYNYTPVAATKLFGTMTITRSFYIQPRYVSLLKYQSIAGDPGIGAASCPGFS